MQAKSGTVVGVEATFPIPSSWPDQKVRIVNREFSVHVSSQRFRKSRDGVEQVMLKMARIAPGQIATATCTYEITKTNLPIPEKPETLIVPRKAGRDVKRHLGASPQIESRHASIRGKLAMLVKEKKTAWKQVEAIYDFVRENIKFQDGRLKGAVSSLRDGHASRQDLVNTFIAFCRAHRVPARTVWVPDHSYAEFYLEDDQGKGRWYQCDLIGARQFGAVTDQRPILQRGDRFQVPEKGRTPLRFVPEHIKARGSRPAIQFVRELTGVAQ